MLCLYLTVLAGAILPAFHDSIHADSGNSSHRCAITLLSSGLIDITGPTVHVLSAPEIFVGSIAAWRVAFATVDYCFSSERAPPVSLV